MCMCVENCVENEERRVCSCVRVLRVWTQVFTFRRVWAGASHPMSGGWSVTPEGKSTREFLFEEGSTIKLGRRGQRKCLGRGWSVNTEGRFTTREFLFEEGSTHHTGTVGLAEMSRPGLVRQHKRKVYNKGFPFGGRQYASHCDGGASGKVSHEGSMPDYRMRPAPIPACAEMAYLAPGTSQPTK